MLRPLLSAHKVWPVSDKGPCVDWEWLTLWLSVVLFVLVIPADRTKATTNSHRVNTFQTCCNWHTQLYAVLPCSTSHIKPKSQVSAKRRSSYMTNYIYNSCKCVALYRHKKPRLVAYFLSLFFFFSALKTADLCNTCRRFRALFSNNYDR